MYLDFYKRKKHTIKTLSLVGLLAINISAALAQNGIMKGHVTDGSSALEFASVAIPELAMGAVSDAEGHFEIKNIPAGSYRVEVSSVGYTMHKESIVIEAGETKTVVFNLKEEATSLNEVVVTGTMKPVSRKDSPVPVEIITPSLFKKNPTPTLFEAVELVNGVKPQLNCNVCNTGDIHINGMEGPYTMILIDGMPIVSALATVYGLMGIPSSLVERIEVVKGPASSLYGSEAMGGIINVITKNPHNAPTVNVDLMATSYNEYSADGSVKLPVGKKATSMLSANYFNFTKPTDRNHDNFTDVTIQDRVSVFNKWSFERKDNRVAGFGVRYVSEKRWGGEMNWSPRWRGSDSIYGESINTHRIEFIGAYQLPVKEKIITQFSYNFHKQDSWYADNTLGAKQHVAFGQLYWDKKVGKAHDLLLGASFRYTQYDDNTSATEDTTSHANRPEKTPLPGIFVQDQWTFGRSTLLGGYRLDYDHIHGAIHSPRLAYRLSINNNNTLRASFGTGFRVVNIFSEDHAALNGAWDVKITESLNPERSYNGNLNYVWSVPFNSGGNLNIDFTGFYSYFTNKIIADYRKDTKQILYANLDGYAVSRGASLNVQASLPFPLSLSTGATFADVYTCERDEEGVMQWARQLHAPKWSGVVTADYRFNYGFTATLTGTWTGPQRLVVLEHDYRPEYSPWFAIFNLQITKTFKKGIEIYGGVKNLFNFIPKEDPIMRPHDPFDKHVDSPDNPYHYTFEPSYNYAPLQGLRVFLGVRYNLW